MFLGGHGSRPNPNLHLCDCLLQRGVGGADLTRHGLVPNIQGMITVAKNILVNSVICVLKVRENAAGAKM